MFRARPGEEDSGAAEGIVRGEILTGITRIWADYTTILLDLGVTN